MKVLLAVDLSEPVSMTRQAVQFAERLDADLLVLHVEERMPTTAASSPEPVPGLGGVDPYAPYDPALEENIEQAREHAFHAFLTEHFDQPVRAAFHHGKPVRRILDDAEEEGAELIMLGKHHRGTLEKMLLGSVASKIVDKAPVPTLLLPITEED